MQLEQYFDFLDPNDIRIKGHRIGIDDVLAYYREGYTAEEIVVQFPSLSLEEVYATITYYLHNQAEVDSYLSRITTVREVSQAEQDAHDLPPVAQRVRETRAQREQARQAA